MSLIEDALHRAQQTLHSPPAVPALTASPAADASLPSSALNLGTIGVGGVVLVGAMIWVLWSLFAPPAAPTAAVHAPARAVHAEPSTRPLLRQSSAPEFTLHGVAGGSGEALAIINGEVFRIGETVEGATLTGIGSDSVTLHRRNQEIVLKTAD